MSDSIESSDAKSDLLSFGTFLLFYLPFLIFVIFFIVIAARGLENPRLVQALNIYIWGSAIVVILVIVITFLKWFMKDKRDYLAMLYYRHDPEQTPLSNLPVIGTIVKNPALLICYCSLAFIPFFQILSTNQTFLAWIPLMGQSLTSTGNFFYNIAMPVTFENGMGAFVIGSINLLLYWIFVKKLEMEYSTFFMISLLITGFIFAPIWVLYHALRYGNNEIAQLTTGFFGWAGAVLTILFGSWIPWALLHTFNNLYATAYDLKILNTPLFMTSIVLLWIVFLLLAIIIYLYKPLSETLTDQYYSNEEVYGS